MSSPQLVATRQSGDILTMYLAALKIVVSAALVKDNNQVYRPIYYVSKSLQGAEQRYS